MAQIKSYKYLIEYKDGSDDVLCKELLEESIDDIFDSVSKIVKKYNGKWIIIFVSCISVIVFLNLVYEVYARMRRKQNRSLDIAEIGIRIVM